MSHILILNAIYAMWGILNIACLNINGLREMNKVASVIGMLKADIICLQETHWSEDIMENIKKNMGGGHFCKSWKPKSMWCGDFDKKRKSKLRIYVL